MLGAIAGDIIGSVYERHPTKRTDFPLFQPHCRFTDDTVLTVAVASALLEQADYGAAIKSFGQRFPDAGYGSAFSDWLHAADSQPYHSWGNGSAMRVSPIGFAGTTVAGVLQAARQSAEVTHNHPEGIKGAQAVALAIFLARHGESKETLRREISQQFGYDLSRTVDAIRPTYHFDVSCQGSVPEAIIAFLDSTDYEDAIRQAVSLGGDSDTLACMTGGIAQAFYRGVPLAITRHVRGILPDDFLDILDRFNAAHGLL